MSLLGQQDLDYLACLIQRTVDADETGTKKYLVQEAKDDMGWAADLVPKQLVSGVDRREGDHVSSKEWLCFILSSEDYLALYPMIINMMAVNRLIDVQFLENMLTQGNNKYPYPSGKNTWADAPPCLIKFLENVERGIKKLNLQRIQ